MPYEFAAIPNAQAAKENWLWSFQQERGHLDIPHQFTRALQEATETFDRTCEEAEKGDPLAVALAQKWRWEPGNIDGPPYRFVLRLEGIEFEACADESRSTYRYTFGVYKS